MDFTFETGGTYIPKWRGNDTLPPAEQIKIRWEYPTQAERSKIKYISPYKFTLDGKIKDEMEYVLDSVQLVRVCVKAVENLTVNKKAVTDGNTLAECQGVGDLFDEVAYFLTPKLSEVDQKN